MLDELPTVREHVRCGSHAPVLLAVLTGMLVPAPENKYKVYMHTDIDIHIHRHAYVYVYLYLYTGVYVYECTTCKLTCQNPQMYMQMQLYTRM